MLDGYTRVAGDGELAPGEMKRVEVGGRRLLLANVEGRYYAIDEVCPHADGPLSEGFLEADVVDCPWHGAQFNVRTGAVLSPPASRGVRGYAVRVESGDVLVGPPLG